MKKYILILLTLFFVGFSYAQTEDKKEKTLEELIPPQFKECENINIPENKRFVCFKERLDKHVRDTFKYPEKAIKKKIVGRVDITFCINTDGTITTISVKAPHKLLENEAKRIIESLPTLIPAKDKDGKPTEVAITYPINFYLL
ncbi:energy transducer TonB [Capnocytophaga sputigena]|jgi:tonB family C-terminal domain|uniref:energy transducer TonB n=1 Tax=Capnocytophaga sputigena TaxID=1019 RepID=UPI0028EEC05A|nr:energy transducer TonB [Capnocytophaga sputigena]